MYVDGGGMDSTHKHTPQINESKSSVQSLKWNMKLKTPERKKKKQICSEPTEKLCVYAIVRGLDWNQRQTNPIDKHTATLLN